MLKERTLFVEMLQDNERNTNKTVAVVSVALFLLSVIFLGLSLFVSSPSAMFIATYVLFPTGCLCLIFALVALRKDFQAPWIKHMLLFGVLLACASSYLLTPWFSPYLLFLPLILSVRYFDKKLIIRVTYISIILIGVSLVANITLEAISPDFAAFHERLESNIWDEPLKIFVFAFMPLSVTIGYVSYYLIALATDLKSVAHIYTDQRVRASAVASELDTAAGIQSSSLPPRFFSVPGGAFKISARVIPTRAVGGDFYDYFPLGEHYLAVLVADVSDKGVPAALFMMSAKKAMRCALECSSTLDDAVRLANKLICEDNQSDMFLTMWVAIIDIRSGMGKFANAGHLYPLIKHANGSVDVIKNEPNMFMGNFPDYPPATEAFQMTHGDVLLLYTDGVTDAENTAHEHFGTEGVLWAAHFADPNARALDETVISQASAFAQGCQQFDDMTVLALQCVRLEAPRELRVTVDACYEGVKKLIDEVDLLLRDLACPDDVRRKVCVVLDEVGSNIVENAYVGIADADCAQNTIELRTEAGSSFIDLHIMDGGIEFNPLAQEDIVIGDEPQIGGFGIHFVKQFADVMSYERKDNRNLLSLRILWGM